VCVRVCVCVCVRVCVVFYVCVCVCVASMPSLCISVCHLPFVQDVDVYTENKREVVVIDTDNSRIAFIAVGATMVGSINMTNCEVGSTNTKLRCGARYGGDGDGDGDGDDVGGDGDGW